jgi:hypothetical protein
VGITGKQRGRHIFADGVGGGTRMYAADGPISPNGGTHYLTKTGAAGAHTLVAPPGDGITMRIINRTAFAHIITATGLVDDGTAAASKNTITAAAFPGASIDLTSGGGKWNASNKTGFTVT